MISVSIQITLLLLAIAAAVLYLIARLIEPSSAKQALSQYFDACLLGILLARFSYIALWWSDYWQSPKAMLALADGGYIPWLGIAAGAAYLCLKNKQRLWQLSVITLAILGGATLYLSQHFLQAEPQGRYAIADVGFTVLGQEAAKEQLSQYQGKVTIVNLWATWCPPCRREMPQFQLAEQQLPQVNFIMLNQGESAETVQAFLQDKSLHFQNVWLDNDAYAMDAMQAKALPSTLFINAQGELVYLHLGELSVARIKEVVGQLASE